MTARFLSVVILSCLPVLAGCTGLGRKPSVPPAPGDLVARPLPRPDGRAVPAEARTVEEFDTSSPAERAEAAGASAGGGRALGLTVATLGNPARPGFWLETPLVARAGPGRVEAPNGKAVTVDLIPIDAPPGAGSRISLAALRLLELPLTGLHELKVFQE